MDIGDSDVPSPRRTAASIRRAFRLIDPRAYVEAARAIIVLSVRERSLTLELAKREIQAEHAGKAFGSFWGVFQPLFLLAVYAFVYGVVFKAKIGGTFELPRSFTVYLLSGLVPWFAFLYVMAKAATVITSNTHLVKQVVFNVEALPLGAAYAALVPLTLGLGFVAFFSFATYRALPWTYLVLPVAVALQLVAMMGLAFALAAIGVFFRDIRDFVQLAAVVLIFLMPIVYLPGSVPAAFNPLLWLNPFTYMVYVYQDVLYYGRIEHPLSWLVFALWSFLVLAIGFHLFRRTSPFFANVL
jgi:lipopolysaccharide transport system permease protein